MGIRNRSQELNSAGKTRCKEVATTLQSLTRRKGIQGARAKLLLKLKRKNH